MNCNRSVDKMALWHTGDRVTVNGDTGTVRAKTRVDKKLLIIFDNKQLAWIDVKLCTFIKS